MISKIHTILNGAHARLWGAVLIMASAVMFAVLGLFIKILGNEYRVWDIAFYRFAGGALVLFALFGRSAQLFRPNNPKLILVRGITGASAFLCVVFAIRLVPLSTAMVLFYSFPAFSTIFSPLLFGERIGIADILCTLIAFIGVAVILDYQMGGPLVGQIMAVIASMLAGLTISIISKLRKTHSAAIIYFYFCLIGTLITLGPFAAAPQWPQGNLEWAIIAGILFTSTAGQLLMTQGLRYCKSWEGGLLMTSEVIFITILGILILNETVGTRFYMGGALIVSSAIILHFINHDPQQRGEKPIESISCDN